MKEKQKHEFQMVEFHNRTAKIKKSLNQHLFLAGNYSINWAGKDKIHTKWVSEYNSIQIRKYQSKFFFAGRSGCLIGPVTYEVLITRNCVVSAMFQLSVFPHQPETP